MHAIIPKCVHVLSCPEGINIHDKHFSSYYVLYEAYAAKVCVYACMLLLMACQEHISLTMTSRDMRFPL